MHSESSILKRVPGILHGFGTRSDPVPNPFLKAWVADKPTWNQVHGIEAREVLKANQACGDVDALFTRSKHPIGVVTADCIPILMARKDGGMVAAIHAGWRGTIAKIVENVWKQLRDQGEDPKNWVAALGPSIQAECYTVGEDLIEQFVKAFPHIEREELSPKERKLDLSAVNAVELARVGMELKDIDLLEECTYCTLKNQIPVFRSYRREGAGVRQYSVIQRMVSEKV